MNYATNAPKRLTQEQSAWQRELWRGDVRGGDTMSDEQVIDFHAALTGRKPPVS